MSKFSYLIKFIIVGDTSVGKTCINLRFLQDEFRETYEVTIGAEFGSKIIRVNNESLKLQIWDTAGQENFRSLTRSYYRSAAVAVLVYDISKFIFLNQRRSTFNSLMRWLSELREHCAKKIEIVLVGNKKDLEHQLIELQEGK